MVDFSSLTLVKMFEFCGINSGLSVWLLSLYAMLYEFSEDLTHLSMGIGVMLVYKLVFMIKSYLGINRDYILFITKTLHSQVISFCVCYMWGLYSVSVKYEMPMKI